MFGPPSLCRTLRRCRHRDRHGFGFPDVVVLKILPQRLLVQRQLSVIGKVRSGQNVFHVPLQILQFTPRGVEREKNVLYGSGDVICGGADHGFSGVFHYLENSIPPSVLRIGSQKSSFLNQKPFAFGVRRLLVSQSSQMCLVSRECFLLTRGEVNTAI